MCSRLEVRQPHVLSLREARAASVVAVRGGDTLQIAPPQNFKNGSPDFIPTIYLGRHQVAISSVEIPTRITLRSRTVAVLSHANDLCVVDGEPRWDSWERYDT